MHHQQESILSRLANTQQGKWLLWDNVNRKHRAPQQDKIWLGGVCIKSNSQQKRTDNRPHHCFGVGYIICFMSFRCGCKHTYSNRSCILYKPYYSGKTAKDESGKWREKCRENGISGVFRCLKNGIDAFTSKLAYSGQHKKSRLLLQPACLILVAGEGLLPWVAIRREGALPKSKGSTAWRFLFF